MTTVSFVHHSLSPQTHQLADEALAGHWGRTLADLPLTLDGTTLTDVSDERLYAECVTLIAEQAQVRIIPGERLVGSASLALAPKHVVPVYRQGKPIFPSTSHLTLGFDYALKVGYRGLRAEINERLSRGDLDEKGCDLLHAMLICLNAATRWHQRYVDALTDAANTATGEQREHYQQIIARLHNVPENPPTTFAEAVQSLWFMFAFQRLCGNWPGIGRIDVMLGPYLRADLAAKTITLNEAREQLAHFWIMGCEWIGAETSFGGSGDAQHYQNIVLSGVDADGHDITNDVTYLILDIVEELHISDFPIAVRINRDSPDRLLRRIAEVQRCGGGIVAIYNEETVLDSMVRFGYPLREARRFANDGCWEVQIPGETCFTYRPFDTLALLQEVLGVHSGTPLPCHDDFASFYTAFRDRLFEQGRGYYACGARYTLFAPHAGGIPDTANSLLAIKQLVYDEQQLPLSELADCLRKNWQGQEDLRLRVLRTVPRYGNDIAEADAMTKRIFDDFLVAVEQVRERNGVLRPAGVSTFGREIEWRGQRGATADGHGHGDILATNFSPSPGSDTQGPTAVIRSHCAMDLQRLPSGTALELKMAPESVKGEDGLKALMALMRSFVELGGFFMHIDVISSDVLREAQQHPEQFANLAVRVSGWSARFVTLGADWQEMIINRSQQVIC